MALKWSDKKPALEDDLLRPHQPLFFASNAIYPISAMPGWLQVIARANPLSCEVNALRSLMLAGGPVGAVGIDFAVLLGVTAVLVILGGRLYPTVIS